MPIVSWLPNYAANVRDRQRAVGDCTVCDSHVQFLASSKWHSRCALGSDGGFNGPHKHIAATHTDICPHMV
eukprot:5776368-Pleurochrysis_carterae.AAC.2